MGRLRMSDEERLLRCLIGVAPRRAREEPLVRELFARSDPALLRETFERDRLVPLAGGRLVAIVGDMAPEWLRTWVDQHTAAAQAWGERHELIELLVLGALKRAGVAAMPLKGSRVARDVHGSLALRSAGDIDVLVAEEDLARGVSALVAEGWSPPGDPVGKDGLPMIHFALDHKGGLPPVELHWRVHFHERTWARGVLERSDTGPGEREPSAGDLLALLLLLYAREGCNNLRLAADVAGWWDRFGDAPMAGALASVDAVPSLRPAFVTAAVAAERAVGLPSARVLGLHVRSPGCSRLGVQFATLPLAATDEQRKAERRLADHLLAPASELVPSLRRQAIPSPAVAVYLRPHLADDRRRLAADVLVSALMVPTRAVIAGLRLRGSAVGTQLEVGLDRRRAELRGGAFGGRSGPSD